LVRVGSNLGGRGFSFRHLADRYLSQIRLMDLRGSQRRSFYSMLLALAYPMLG
jgi:hypothetical protein